MRYRQSETIRTYYFDSLNEKHVCHGLITRRGGISPEPWASLNVGGTVGDDPSNVLENRQRSFEGVGRSVESMYDVWQVHGTEVVCAKAPRPLNEPHLQADAILTDQPGVTLFMRFADCVPILLYDPARRVVGLVHAGWQGTVSKIAFDTVQRMRDCYQSNPNDILAGIGPSIAAHHYEVGPEVVAHAKKAFGEDARQFFSESKYPDGSSGVKFDLWAANQYLLEAAGITHIELSNICTACNLDDWYSHRGEMGRTGRFGAIIGL